MTKEPLSESCKHGLAGMIIAITITLLLMPLTFYASWRAQRYATLRWLQRHL